jgi:ribose transport system substrate-binding protein
MLKRVVPLLLFALASLHADDFTIGVVPKATNQDFWKTVRAGAQKAANEAEKAGSDIQMLWSGPAKEDDRERQVQVVETLVGRRVSGILLAPCDDTALIPPVETALNAEIPVVTLETPLATGLATSAVSTNNFEAGHQAADVLGALLKGKGKVVMLRYVENMAQTEARENGFMEEMRFRFPKIKVVSADQHAGATAEMAYSASQNLLNRFGKEADAIFTPHEEVTAAMLRALNEAGLAGKTKLVGFGSSSPLVEAVRAGQVQVLLAEDGFELGYLGMKNLVQHLQGKHVERKVEVPVKVVTPANLDDIAIQQALHPPIQGYSEEPNAPNTER